MNDINIEQKTNTVWSRVTGRNGYFDMIALQRRSTQNVVYFNCIGKSGKVLNAGFRMDRKSFEMLMDKLINSRNIGSVTLHPT